ncbi:hypothetical protein HanHA300_Chr16g0613331 [Helianthus annuus]|nr:hypothetical protein HanHA300_Chr16g0613331 [Helianthus annuus]KAJ0460703.1 hypothetical protein HanHA89_Chr16g0663921 [Helianthus annuus]
MILTKSSLRTSKKCLIKPKLNLSGPEARSLSHSHTASLISCTVNGTTNSFVSSNESCLRFGQRKLGRCTMGSINLKAKNFLASNFILIGSVTHTR